jgi:hypothetical protein
MPTGGIAGYSSPVLFDAGNGYELLVGSERGQVFHYTNIDGNLGGQFTLADTMYQDISELKRVTIAMADIDGDTKFDLLTGCLAGGMRLYTQRLSSGLTDNALQAGFSVFPNPARDLITIRVRQAQSGIQYRVNLMQADGRMVKSENLTPDMQLQTSGLTSGVYIISLTDGKNISVQKLIIQ